LVLNHGLDLLLHARGGPTIRKKELPAFDAQGGSELVDGLEGWRLRAALDG
jgi:hypothetical protein